MATGRIKTLMKDRGFGFIQVDGANEEVFFHSSSLSNGGFDDLREGQRVGFEIEPDPRNPRRSRAGNVRLEA